MVGSCLSKNLDANGVVGSRLIDSAISWAAATVSAILTVRLLVELADTTISKAILAVLGIILELAKVRTWQLRKRSFLFRSISWLIVLLSLMASLGSALAIVETTASTNDSVHDRETNMAKRIEDLEMERRVLVNKLADLPSLWVTRAKEITQAIARIDVERQGLVSTSASTANTQRPPGTVMFTLLAGMLGVDRRILVVWFLMAIAMAVELTVLSMMPDVREAGSGKNSHSPKPVWRDISSKRSPRWHGKSSGYHQPGLFDVD